MTSSKAHSNRFENVPVVSFASSVEASVSVASEIAALIRIRQSEGRPVVLGLATGSTPLSLYAELVRLHRVEGLSFANVITFNLDEYCGLPEEHPQSYHAFMWHHLFRHLDIPATQIHLPDGNVPQSELEASCARYEEKIAQAGGLDFQILGIGRTGHIGFNEPGSAKRSRTRQVLLDPLTRRDAAGDFGGEEHTPRSAVTMGVRSIMEARRVVLMAWGQHKAEIVRKAVEGEITAQVTASFLQEHDNVSCVLDEAAASALTRHRTPWLVGPLVDQGLAWDERLQRRAILWLSQIRKKAILKLTDEDYNEGNLQDLLAIFGSAYEANLAGFYQVQHTITGWPGGRDPSKTKPGDAPVRPLRASSAGLFPKRILVLSPHPDDDVVAMGGTLCRLVQHGHEVHVAYQVSGATAVSDEALWTNLLFLVDSGLLPPEQANRIRQLNTGFQACGALPATEEVLGLKAAIRRREAIAAARTCGIPESRLHFLNLPFYSQSGKRRALGDGDVSAMSSLLEELKPHVIYAAGDLDDPNGTHRLCLHALRKALERHQTSPWFGETELWFYRGAWAEWQPDEIDMAVPLSPQEMLRRRRAIVRHETLKDQPLILGDERRQFWQHAEDRCHRLADLYNAFGLAEYEAMEAFKRYSPQEFLQLVQL